MVVLTVEPPICLQHIQTLVARNTTKVYCQVTGDWPLGCLAVSEGKVTLQSDIDPTTALVHLDPAMGNFMHGVSNDTAHDLALD